MTIVIISIIAIFTILVLGSLTYFYYDFQRGTQKIDSYYQNLSMDKIRNFGTTKTLEILPLIDWYADVKDIKGEAGLSYLIKTDDALILFDVGLNSKRETPSPLVHNMKKLGVDFNKIDMIVISHNHPDHVGGLRLGEGKSFILPTDQPVPKDKKIYTPVEMTYPGLNPILAEKPMMIAKGVATTGTIPNYLFFTGWTPEQSLAINVRTGQLFDVPIYGILGGLHFPVSESRYKTVFGIPLQKVFGTGKPPWRFITRDDVNKNISELKKINPKIVALSAHDSCDESIDAFRTSFPSAFQYIRVGKHILIAR